jgi:hypothetical protein
MNVRFSHGSHDPENTARQRNSEMKKKDNNSKKIKRLGVIANIFDGLSDIFDIISDIAHIAG